jgi:hypothetical protein
VTRAYYLNSIPGHHGSFDRVGGLPTHEPPKLPICRTCGDQLAFLAQLYSDSDWSWPGDCLCLHVYQCPSDDPLPVVIPVPRDAPFNFRAVGRRHPLIARRDIFRELHVEPPEDSLTLDTASELPFVSKLGGSIGPYSGLPDGVQFLGQLLEDPFDFNFATRQLLFYLNDSAEIDCDLL